MKKVLLLIMLLFSESAAAYTYSYMPKTSSPVIYNFLYRKREKCQIGEKQAYPKQIGVCVSCPENSTYLIDDTKNKAYCFRCPGGTLLAKKDGYPMCLSQYPVINGKAVKSGGRDVPEAELERMALTLNASYKTALPPKEQTAEKTFRNKSPLQNVCPSVYPDDAPKAAREIEICKRLAKQNDFLCPYVEKNAENRWTCRACPKNAPYKDKQGGCFTCPYGEEMVSLPDGKSVCASMAPKPEKKKPAVKKSTGRKKAVKRKKRR